MTDLADLKHYLLFAQDVKCYLAKLPANNEFLMFVCAKNSTIKVYKNEELILECTNQRSQNPNNLQWNITIKQTTNTDLIHTYSCNFATKNITFEDGFITCFEAEYGTNQSADFYNTLLTHLWSIMTNANKEAQLINDAPNRIINSIMFANKQNLLKSSVFYDPNQPNIHKLISTNNALYTTNHSPYKPNLYIDIADVFTKLNNKLYVLLIEPNLHNVDQWKDIIAFDVMFDEFDEKWVYGVMIKNENNDGFIFKTINIEDLVQLDAEGNIIMPDLANDLTKKLFNLIKQDLHPEFDLALNNQALNFFANEYMKDVSFYSNRFIRYTRSKLNAGLINFYNRWYNLKKAILNQTNIKTQSVFNLNERIIDLDGENLSLFQFYKKYQPTFYPKDAKISKNKPQPKTRL